jgi:RNA polymerase sigma factor for flagellar operon FliA
MTAVAINDEVDPIVAMDGSAGTDSPANTAAEIDALVRAHLPLVGHLVRELLTRVPSHVNRDDLTSAGMLALAMAAKGFDATRGVPFGRFAAIRIRGALTDELRTMDWASRAVRGKAREIEATRTQLTAMLGRAPRREEVAQAMGVSVRDVDGVDADVQRASVLSLQGLTPDDGAELLPTGGDGPEGLLIKREQLGYLRDAITELPERLRIVVQQYFFEQRKMADIAAELGVTESRVSQLRSEALVLLREGMQAVEGTPPTDITTGGSRRRTSARDAYRAAVAGRSTVAGRLSASTLLAEPRPMLVAAN